MFYKIKSIKPLDNFILLVIFENTKQKYYDIKPLIKNIPAFKDLININGLYSQVKVDIGGYGISWNENLDLSCNELWYNGTIETNCN